MSWTLPNDLTDDEIEACLVLLDKWSTDDDGTDLSGFVDTLGFMAHWVGPDGESNWSFRTITNEQRLVPIVGLLELSKIQVIAECTDADEW